MFLQDLRYALRQLRNNPGFTALAVGTLALGIAANATIFSWINSTLLDPIPAVAHTGNMISIMLGERNEHPTPPFSYPDYVDLRDSTRSFTGLLAYHDDYMAITGSGKPERIYGALTSANYFEVLGVQPILGRTLLPSLANERQGVAEAVLGYDLWQNRFAGDRAIVGKTIQLNLHPYTIVGVAPKSFIGCKSGLRSEIWIPLGMAAQLWGYNGTSITVAHPGFRCWASSSRAWTSPGDQRTEPADAAHRQSLSRDASGINEISADPLWRSPFGANVYLSGTLPMLLALAAALLLLACANVANLLLVRRWPPPRIGHSSLDGRHPLANCAPTAWWRTC